jgi:hypothetical protein
VFVRKTRMPSVCETFLAVAAAHHLKCDDFASAR